MEPVRLPVVPSTQDPPIHGRHDGEPCHVHVASVGWLKERKGFAATKTQTDRQHARTRSIDRDRLHNE